MKDKILTKKGEVISVSPDDYDTVIQYKWYINSMGYVVSRKSTLIHRVIMNPSKGMVVDHINGDKLDNRRENLRVCTRAQNNQNRVKVRSNIAGGTKSGYKGVRWRSQRQKWIAALFINRKCYYGPYRTCPHMAAEDYNKIAIEKVGEFARLNIIDEQLRQKGE